MPLSRAHTRDQFREAPPAAAVQLNEVIWHQARLRHRLSLRADDHQAEPSLSDAVARPGWQTLG